jgi:translation initiation factor 3 subunit L
MKLIPLMAADRGDLPNNWIWDIFDECLYQLSSVSQRPSLKNAKPDVWNAKQLMLALEQLVQNSKVLDDLKMEDGSWPKSGWRHQSLVSGLFAIVSLSRLDVLLGDFSGALRRLEPLDLSRRGKRPFHLDPAAHITLNYNVGFCYLMMRRYVDAMRSFRRCVAVPANNRQFSSKIQSDAATMYTMTAILGGLPHDDLLSYVKTSHFNDEVLALHAGDENLYRDIFTRCSPKFLFLCGDQLRQWNGAEGKDLQTKMFMREVKQQLRGVKLRGYLEVYQSITVEKLKVLLGVEDGLAELLAMKHKTRQLVHDERSPDLLSGSFSIQTSACIEVDGESISVARSSSDTSIEMKYNDRILALTKRLKLAAKPAN